MRVRLVRHNKPDTHPFVTGRYIFRHEHQMTFEEHLTYLKAKLCEEMGELEIALFVTTRMDINAPNFATELENEIADVYECLRSICDLTQIRSPEVLGNEKFLQYGGYSVPVLYEEYPREPRNAGTDFDSGDLGS